MKFLVDAQLPARLARRLVAAGYLREADLVELGSRQIVVHADRDTPV